MKFYLKEPKFDNEKDLISQIKVLNKYLMNFISLFDNKLSDNDYLKRVYEYYNISEGDSKEEFFKELLASPSGVNIYDIGWITHKLLGTTGGDSVPQLCGYDVVDVGPYEDPMFEPPEERYTYSTYDYPTINIPVYCVNTSGEFYYYFEGPLLIAFSRCISGSGEFADIRLLEYYIARYRKNGELLIDDDIRKGLYNTIVKGIKKGKVLVSYGKQATRMYVDEQEISNNPFQNYCLNIARPKIELYGTILAPAIKRKLTEEVLKRDYDRLLSVLEKEVIRFKREWEKLFIMDAPTEEIKKGNDQLREVENMLLEASLFSDKPLTLKRTFKD